MISFDLDELSTTTQMGSYSKAEPRSGALVGNTMYMMGIDDDFNVWFYSMDIYNGESSTVKRIGDGTTPADMSYDYSTNTLYFIANSEATDGVSAIGTINPETGKVTFLKDLAYYCKAIAIDARGEMYVLTSNGYLLMVNKSNGNCAVIGSTNVQLASRMGFHSMEFDRESGALYLAAWTDDEKTVLYSIDTATGEATSLGEIGDGSHTIALGIPYAPADENAPGRVTNASISANQGGALSAILRWTNPLNDINGNPLEGVIRIEIVNYASGEKTIIEDCQPGKAMQQFITVNEPGLYEFCITAVNEAGASAGVLVKAWIGHDVPAAVTNAVAKLNPTQLMVNDLSWTTPVKGAHGGYLDRTSLKYDIVRMNDGKTIAENISATRFSDTLLLDDLTRYNYQIFAKNNDGMGESAMTNDLVNGPAQECPYIAPFNSWEESGQYWTVIDANNDAYAFGWYKDYMNMFGLGYDKGYYIYQEHNSNHANDFIVSPPILFTLGHEYKITATVTNDDVAGYREETFRFYTLTGYDVTSALPLGDEDFTVKHPGTFRNYSLTFTVENEDIDEESFTGFIALCCNSRPGMGMLLVSSLAIEDVTPSLTGDVNCDGEINIADVNALIEMILSDNLAPNGDINNDGEITISDLNMLIDIILSY